MTYALSTTVNGRYDETVEAPAALADQGFGVLTEIDLSGTLKEKMGAGSRPGDPRACRPPLAYEAVEAPSIGLLLPCNVVVRYEGETTTTVEVLDPQVMVSLTDNPALRPVADDAAQRLRAALDSLG